MRDRRRLGVLLLGASGYQRQYASVVATHPHLSLSCVAEEPTARPSLRSGARRLADELALPFIDDIDAALCDPAVDVVIIDNEATRHAALAIKTMAAGKHAIIETPVATTLEDAEQLCGAADRTTAKVTYLHGCLSPPIQRARQMVDSGELGLPLAMHVEFMEAEIDPEAESAPFIGDRKGSPRVDLMDFLFCPVDCLGWICGLDVVSVHASTTRVRRVDPDAAGQCFGLISLELEHGVLATVVAGGTGARPHPAWASEVLIVGSQGTLQIDGNRPRGVIISERDDVADGLAKKPSDPAFLRALIDDLVEAILDDRAPVRTVEDGRRILQVILAADESARSGGVVSLLG